MTNAYCPPAKPGISIISPLLLRQLFLALCITMIFAGCSNQPMDVAVDGEMKRWHPITITFDGLNTDETSNPNPFLDYRLQVTFSHAESGANVTVPGYFAADGNAGETSATGGSKWRAHFNPHEVGTWTYTTSFRKGDEVAISLEPSAGSPSVFDGLAGSFDISETDKTGRDHRGKGVLRYVGERYLQFDDGTFFVKGGADSPENLLAFGDFDGTYSIIEQMNVERDGEAPTSPIHYYRPHVKDWNPGDPTWQGEKGKGLIGAVNYLATKGVNVFSFLTMNVEGDGQDVWPWIEPDVRDRFDVSKLAQWEVLFTHADSLGHYLHFKTQETENDLLMDGGDLGTERKLYYRELIARFGHHHALNWNLGEENDIWEELNDPTQERIKEYISYIHALDAYDHPVVIHSYPNQIEEVYRPLLGDASELDGLSIQTGFDNVYDETLKWVRASSATPRTWVVANDEQNSHKVGVKPDGPDSNRDEIRIHTLWGNLMAGGAGVEYYFGYEHPPHDLNTEDWRSRDLVWNEVGYALSLFQNHVPYWTMNPQPELAEGNAVRVLANPGDAYLVYLPFGGQAKLSIEEGAYDVQWYNPREGGDLQEGSAPRISGSGMVDLGTAPSSPESDWAVLITKS